MKISAEHYTILKDAINETLSKHNANGETVKAYQTGQFRNADKVKDLQRRFCFDLLYASNITGWICRELYPYLNDDHIYTALKSICPKVKD